MKNGYTIIDAHCHLYPEKIAEKATGGLSAFYSLPVRYKGTAADLIERGTQNGVDRFVVAGVATSGSQISSINRFLADVLKESDGKIAVLGAMHPDCEDIESELRLITDSGFSGVKLHADFQKIAINDPRCYRIYEQIAGRLPLLTHTGDSRFAYSNPENLLPVLKAFPSLTVVGAHFGGWSVWEDAAETLSSFDNFVVDTCSSFSFLDDDDILNLFSVYGSDRILFGTDYPMWNAGEELNRLFSLGLSQNDLEKVLSKNAQRVYGL